MRAVDTNVLVFAEITSTPEHSVARELLRATSVICSRFRGAASRSSTTTACYAR